MKTKILSTFELNCSIKKFKQIHNNGWSNAAQKIQNHKNPYGNRNYHRGIPNWVVQEEGISSLAKFWIISSQELTTRAFFSLNDMANNQRILELLEGLPFFGYPIEVASTSHSNITIQVPLPETREQTV